MPNFNNDRSDSKNWWQVVIIITFVLFICQIAWLIGTSVERQAAYEKKRLASQTQAVESTPGLEDCKYIEVNLPNGPLLRVIRCPKSTEVSYEAGKNYVEKIVTK